MDIVYLVKNSPDNEELRYSLRSLKNLKHDKVWIAGHRPDWANTYHIKRYQSYDPFQNVVNLLKATCTNPDVSDDFILFNDDFFITGRTKLETHHRGLYETVLKRYEKPYRHPNRYVRAMKDTKRTLERLNLPTYCYELHLPMIINKQKMLEAMSLVHESSLKDLNKRSLYGNYVGLKGKRVEDVKITELNKLSRKTFISTTEKSFELGLIGEQIRKTFNRKCRYER
jgi:hypothetical protein